MSRQKKIHSHLHAAIALLLGTVLVFNIAFSNLHECLEHFKINNELNCSDEKEQDACHRFIFHHEKSEGCDGSHKHVDSKHEDCFGCKYVKERPTEAFLPEHGFLHTVLKPFKYAARKHNTLVSSLYTIYLRGPPVIS